MLHGCRRSAPLAAAASLLAYLAAPSVADAQPRRVVIVNLAADQASGAAAAQRLRGALAPRPGLAALPPGDLTRALEAALGADPTARALAAARAEIDTAIEAFGAFEAERAASALDSARDRLLAATPNDAVNAALAEIAFERARLHLRAGDRRLAKRDLELAARLAPERAALDPVRYPPALVALDTGARLAQPASARLTVTATFDGAPVFVDGHRAGTTPAALELGAGLHHIVIAAADLEIASARVELDAGEAKSVQLDLTRRSRAARAEALRRDAMATELGDDAASAAARAAIELAGVDAAFVLVGDGPAIAAYDGRLETLSRRRAIDDQVERIFAWLEPPPTPELVPDDGAGDDDEAPWYRRRWGLAAIGGGVVAAVIGAVVLLNDDGGADRPWDVSGFPE